MPSSLQLLIKPASSACNEHCSYCFYGEEAAARSVPDCGSMNHETARALIRRAFAYADNSCDFIFQGGEPLLAGLEFYEDFLKTANELNGEAHRGKPLTLSWSLQTNGSLIDDEVASFLKKNDFLVGVSVDGPRELHDAQRGSGSFARTMKGIGALKKAGVDCNVLCVVTRESCRRARSIYDFFRSQGFLTQQYIPCLPPLKTAGLQCPMDSLAPSLEDYGLAPSPEDYGLFLCQLFDLWEKDIRRGEPVSVRYFENIARILLGMAPESCGMSGRCTVQFTVEANGDVYPCDFYALDEYRLGNVRESSLEEMEHSALAEHFSAPHPAAAQCRACRYYKLCRGGCKRERSTQNPDTTRLCQGYLCFFDYAVERLWRLLADMKRI